MSRQGFELCLRRLLNLNNDDVSRILDIFFKDIQPVPVFSFMHRASVLQRYQAGLLDKALLLTIIGLTTCLTQFENATSAFTTTCMSIAEDLVLRDIEHPSVLKLQALVLVVKYKTYVKQFASAFMLFGLAARSAFGLRLNYESPGLCFLAQESRRRLMWSLYIIDSGLAGGLRDFVLCSETALHLRMPCRDRSFELDAPELEDNEDTENARPTIKHKGSLTLYIQIMMLRSKILYQTKDILRARVEDAKHIVLLVKRLEHDIDSFCKDLPPDYHFSEKNLRLRAYAGRLPRYVVIHIWLHQCYCDLYRLLLTGLREALPASKVEILPNEFVQDCQRKCMDRARAISNILGSLMTLERYLPLFDLDMNICAYQAARLLFYGRRREPLHRASSSGTTMADVEKCLSFTALAASRSLAFRSIHDDMKALFETGQSSDVSPSGSASPSSRPMCEKGGKQDVHASQVMSRHSLIRQSGIVDDSDNLGMLPAEHNMVTSLQAPPLAMAETLASGPPATNAESAFTSFEPSQLDEQENAFQCAMDIWNPDTNTQSSAYNHIDWLQNDWSDPAWQYDWTMFSTNQLHKT
ncbi:hypothetical protein LTR05_003868 [Lithohypha guttulata]|uniref:Xylanolytic transcriptional activator regulatory domain-containing protein n=1 Tax=Lithohypha guttulata TaxID=1690604 RepID=A0AAN7YBF1_9EURO|nr:hypothetical protein LTR05_003868 [Lithohypha guttulata]